jgi:putative sigma-54 modulation protein
MGPKRHCDLLPSGAGLLGSPFSQAHRSLRVQINISTRHGYLSDATRSKVSAKVARLSRHFERLTAIEVTVDLEFQDSPTVDLRVSAEHKHDFVATERASDLWRSINGAVQKIEQQLRKYKEKVTDRHRAHSAREQGAVAGE